MTERELKSLVSRSLFADLGYTDRQGRIQIRRVFCTWHKGLAGHLISTNTSSGHVESLLLNPTACLYFADSRTFEGLCLQGRAVIHREEAWKRLLWHPEDVKYYPLGVDDPDYCVIEFIAESASYYRFDGKGILTREALAAASAGAVWEDGYAPPAKEDP